MDLYSQNFGLKCLILLEMGLFSTIKVHQNFHTMLLLLGLEWFLLEFVFRKRELNFMYFAFICKLNWDGGVINIFICLIYFFVFYNFRPAFLVKERVIVKSLVFSLEIYSIRCTANLSKILSMKVLPK